MERSKKVFVSGVAGFLGSHLAEKLVKAGHEVSGCDNLSGGYVENVPEGVKFYEYDLEDQKKNKEFTQGVDVIFHTAAHAYEGLSVFAPHQVATNVFSTTSSLVSAGAANGVSRFVYCSSMSRYGDQEAPFDESMSTEPITPYGIAKVASEKLIANMSKTHGFEYAIAVPHNIIGPRQKYDDPYRNVAAIMINRMLQDKQPILYGDGQQRRSFSYVDDCVQVLEQLGFSDKAAGEVVNIGPDEEFTSVYELAHEIAQLLNFSLEPIYLPERPNEVRLASCSSDKARQLFGYETRFSLKEGLREMVQWMQLMGPKKFQYHMEMEIENHKLPKSWNERLI